MVDQRAASGLPPRKSKRVIRVGKRVISAESREAKEGGFRTATRISEPTFKKPTEAPQLATGRGTISAPPPLAPIPVERPTPVSETRITPPGRRFPTELLDEAQKDQRVVFRPVEEAPPPTARTISMAEVEELRRQREKEQSVFGRAKGAGKAFVAQTTKSP